MRSGHGRIGGKQPTSAILLPKRSALVLVVFSRLLQPLLGLQWDELAPQVHLSIGQASVLPFVLVEPPDQ